MTETAGKQNNTRALVTMMVTMFIFGSIGIFRRAIPLSSAMLSLARGALGAAVLLIIIFARELLKTGVGSISDCSVSDAVKNLRSVFSGIGKRNILILFVMGMGLGINWMLLFEAYNYTTVSVATLCYYMEPTIVILCSPFIFGERLTTKKLICSAAAILGMIMISGIFESGISGISKRHITGIMFGLAAAVLYAVEVMLNKRKSYIDPFILTMIELAGAAAFMLPYVLLTEDISEVSLTITQTLLVMIVGVVSTGISYSFYFGSMKELKAQTIALFSYIDPITALVLSAVILGERMTMPGIIGAVLILGATAVSEHEQNNT